MRQSTFFAYSLLILISWQLIACHALRPSSLQPGNYSATTGLPLEAAYTESAMTSNQDSSIIQGIEGRVTPNSAPFPDYKVIRFAGSRVLCRDTFQPASCPKLSQANKGAPVTPGIILTDSGLGIDEAEISNLDWHQFELAQLDAGVPPNELAPNSAALPVSDYYSSPFYAYYPVVAISYEQAQLFCQWRTKVVNENFARFHPKDAAEFVCEYRLPTEAEWEEAAAVRSGQPYGSLCTDLKVQVAPGAAAYLQKRANSTVNQAKIRADIFAYNRQHPVRSWINYAQAEPYFLLLASPGYIYQGPANYFGLYQMVGNAAELVQERGITKGGSYRDNLEVCQIKARGSYTGPAPSIGFRAVCTVRRKQ